MFRDAMVGAKKVPMSMDVGMYGSVRLFVCPYLPVFMYVCLYACLYACKFQLATIRGILKSTSHKNFKLSVTELLKNRQTDR